MTGSGGRRPEPSHLVVGHLARAHGTKGEIFVWPLTDRPDEVFAEGETVWLGDAEGRLDEEALPLEVERRRPFKRGVLVLFSGYADRNAAEELAGRYVLAPLAALGEAGPGEWYYHQLLGASVETVNGESVGQVREVYELDPADLLEVEDGAGRKRLIPVTSRVVREVDTEAGRIVIDPPEGLLDL